MHMYTKKSTKVFLNNSLLLCFFFKDYSCNYLANGYVNAGRLEVCDPIGGSATICANEFEDFDDSAATVACTTIGYSPPGC